MDIVEQLRWCGLGFPKFKTNRGDYGICDDAADEIERLRGVMEKVADALYDKGDHECWAALRNALWQQGEKE